MTLAELIIEDASARGLRHYFGLPGGGFPLDLLEAGRQRGVELVSVAHESSAAIMAGYYGHFMKTAGIAVSIKGVGAGNLVGGALNAFMERMPLVCLCEAAPTATAGFDLAQTCEQSELFRPAAKFQVTLTECGVEDTVNHAVAIAIDGRPGPTVIHLPADLSQLECGEPKPVEPPTADEPSDEARLGALRERIGKARRPLIIAGSDILRAGAEGELRRLAENIEAAVLVGMDAKGVLPEPSGRFAGIFTGHVGTTFEAAFLKRADLVIVMGMDSLMREALWYSPTPTCELVARESYRSFSPNPEIRVDGNLRFSLKRLGGLVQPGFSTEEIREVRKPVMRLFERPGGVRFAFQDILDLTREILPAEGALFSETGAHVRILEELWPVDRPNVFFGTTGGRTMGLMLPAILGAKLARPEQAMIGIGADGSLLMRLGELETFARASLRVPLVIVNDQALGTIKSRQKSRGMPEHGLGFYPVDYAAAARACGLEGVVAETPEEFQRALRGAMVADVATIIDARVDPQAYQDAFPGSIGVVS